MKLGLLIAAADEQISSETGAGAVVLELGCVLESPGEFLQLVSRPSCRPIK